MLFYFSFCFVLILLIFFVGFIGILVSVRNNFFIIISVEIMTISLNVNFMLISVYHNMAQGLVFIIFIMVISAIEIVIFLSFFIVFYYKIHIVENINSFNYIKQ